MRVQPVSKDLINKAKEQLKQIKEIDSVIDNVANIISEKY